MTLADLAAALADAYGLSEPRMARLDASGRRLVATVEDAMGRRFVLKNRPPWITRADHVAGLQLQRDAAAQGARIPAVIATASGDLAWRWRGDDLALHDWVDGVPLRWSVAHAHALGGAVGHLGSLNISVVQARDWDFPSGRRRWLPDRPAELRQMAAYLEAPEVPSAFATAVAQALDHTSVDTDDLPCAFLHGDVSPLNAVWDGQGASLIDLDEMRWGHRLFDAAQGVATVAAFDCGPSGPVVRRNWERRRAKAFLNAWALAAHATQAEVRALPGYLTLAAVRTVVGELDLDDPGLPTRSDAAASVAALADLLQEPVPGLPP